MSAVVFDMDGILFDTECLVSKIWKTIAEQRGIEGIEEVLLACVGSNNVATKAIFLERYGQEFGYDAFRKEAADVFYKEIEVNGIPIKEGVHELLDFLKEANYKIGLASSTRYEAIVGHLKAAKIEHYFSVIIAGDMVEHSKPHPEIYMKACKALEVLPSESYCIEDSPNGIRSAFAAGLKVIMVPDLISPTKEIEALLYKKFNSLLQVKAYLQNSLRR